VPGPATIDERFAGGKLDETVWTPAYLPAWSSARDAAATHEVVAEGLRLTIPPEQPLWCPDLHEEPLRVSAIQSGNWSGRWAALAASSRSPTVSWSARRNGRGGASPRATGAWKSSAEPR
jgi:hypothetical protein